MIILKAVIIVIINLIIYLAFGSIVCGVKNKDNSLLLTMVVGFFAYYALFMIVSTPIMLTYRPLSMLSTAWAVLTAGIVFMSVALFGKVWAIRLKNALLHDIPKHKWFGIVIFAIIAIQILLVASTYNFTLDAAYYVANVSTSVDTNMINVYDPFTGAWQDHFELRYVFATYSILDAVICQLTGIPALIETKMVMSSIVMILVNIMYLWICRFLCKGNLKQFLTMFIGMTLVNMTFITLYTSANFLYTRTYEGKSVVANITVIAIFVIYMLVVRNGMDRNKWIMLFVICLGTATVSSTANMLVPAELFVLFVPYVVRHKTYKMLPKLALCMVPELCMLLMYVIYVKGYFAIYTYPR